MNGMIFLDNINTVGEGHGDKGMYGESQEPDIFVQRRVIFVIDQFQCQDQNVPNCISISDV